ncbi:MAG: PIN domain-containing protein [Candidatus Acidiferrum sp.]
MAKAPSAEEAQAPQERPVARWGGGEFWAFRALLVAATVALCCGLQPFAWSKSVAGIAGLLIGIVILLAEWRTRRGAPASVLGGAIGMASGILVALLVALLISRTAVSESTKSWVVYVALLASAYLGLTIGASCGVDFLCWPGWTPARSEAAHRESLKLLDTSVLIDGRIADICEAHFLDGVLGVPEFVLHELQMVADSGDALKRQRGRRGLEILQRMQKMPHLEVRILEDSVPGDLVVDDKLVELARRTGAKMVTNDFNLNKVATLHGIAVLNVNLLANAMKPAVLPGEPMRVVILREGKEPNQGVAYLDDGTMVVVDGGRRMINKSVDVVVTSVHQTTAGKMIFGRLDESAEPSAPAAKQAAAGSRGDGGPNAENPPPGAGRPGNR